MIDNDDIQDLKLVSSSPLPPLEFDCVIIPDDNDHDNVHHNGDDDSNNSNFKVEMKFEECEPIVTSPKKKQRIEMKSISRRRQRHNITISNIFKLTCENDDDDDHVCSSMGHKSMNSNVNTFHIETVKQETSQKEVIDLTTDEDGDEIIENNDNKCSSQLYISSIKNDYPILDFGNGNLIILTEPFWTVKLGEKASLFYEHKFLSQTHHVDYHKPLFKPQNFIRIIDFFISNHRLDHLKRSYGIKNLEDLFNRLNGFSTIAFTDVRQIDSFIFELQQVTRTLVSDTLLKQVFRYIRKNKKWFSEKQLDLIPNNILEHITQPIDNSNIYVMDYVMKKKRVSLDLEEHEIDMEDFNESNRLKIDSIADPFFSNLTTQQFAIYDEELKYQNEGTNALELIVKLMDMKNLRFQRGEYFGELNSKQLPHGEGCWTSMNRGEYYSGYWDNGTRHGEGVLLNQEMNYEGEWSNNTFNGHGKLKILKGPYAGSCYHGEFESGKRHGYGIQFYHFKHEDENEPNPCHDGSSLKKDTTTSTNKETPEQNNRFVFMDGNNGNFHAWYRGQWKSDKRNGLGEFRRIGLWQYGMWKGNDFYDGIGQVISQDVHGNRCYFSTQHINYKQNSMKTMLPNSFLRDLNVIKFSPSPKVPKRTFWNGYCFRSRLETRWAIFFDFLKIDYLYEPRTFNLPDGCNYTPDFYLPMMNIWIEIKPSYPTEQERKKAQYLIDILPETERVILFYGSVQAPFIKKFVDGAKGIEFFRIQEKKDPKEPICWTQCSLCEKVDINIRGRPPCHENANQDSVRPSTMLEMAYNKAHYFDMDGLNAVLNYDKIATKYEDDEEEDNE